MVGSDTAGTARCDNSSARNGTDYEVSLAVMYVSLVRRTVFLL